MDQVLDRKKLTFKQAEGLEELPRPLNKDELSDKLRAQLWSFYYRLFFPDNELTENAFYILRDEHVELFHKSIIQFSNKNYIHAARLEELFMQGSYADVLQHLQFVLRHRNCEIDLRYIVELIFDENQAAWRLQYEGEETTFIPSTNEWEASSVQEAYDALKSMEFGGGRKHLVNAGNALAQRKWNDSIRESISAVESVAKKICNDPNADLAKALATMENSGVVIHGALKKAFNGIYGYTNDEKGVRHALIEEGHNCDQPDAQFMLGACASFISYLLAKAKIS